MKKAKFSNLLRSNIEGASLFERSTLTHKILRLKCFRVDQSAVKFVACDADRENNVMFQDIFSAFTHFSVWHIGNF